MKKLPLSVTSNVIKLFQNYSDLRFPMGSTNRKIYKEEAKKIREFISVTPDYWDYADDILEYMKKHKTLTDVPKTYLRVKKLRQKIT